MVTKFNVDRFGGYTFRGPENKKYTFLIFEVILFLAIVGFISLGGIGDITSFFETILILILILGGVGYIYYRWMKKTGGFRSDAYVFKIPNDRIESKQMDKHHVIYADNIKKIKYERDVGGTGSRVLIWPKDYSRLIVDGIDAEPEVIERMSKQKVPLVLYPPALSREERKRLKEAIEEFKRRHGIE